MNHFTSVAVVALLLWLNLRWHETGLTKGEIIYSDVDDALVSHNRLIKPARSMAFRLA